MQEINFPTQAEIFYHLTKNNTIEIKVLILEERWYIIKDGKMNGTVFTL